MFWRPYEARESPQISTSIKGRREERQKGRRGEILALHSVLEKEVNHLIVYNRTVKIKE